MVTKALCKTISKVFDISRAISKDSQKSRKTESSVRKKGKAIATRAILTETVLSIGDGIRLVKMFLNLHAMDRIENFRKNRSFYNWMIVRRQRTGFHYEESFCLQRDGKQTATELEGGKFRST